jgi:hypothetical protein
MTIKEMRALDAAKTAKELEYTKDQVTYAMGLIKRLDAKIEALEKAGDMLCAAAAFLGWHGEIEQWNKVKVRKP